MSTCSRSLGTARTSSEWNRMSAVPTARQSPAAAADRASDTADAAAARAGDSGVQARMPASSRTRRAA
ncbi:hypothetical protein DEI95_12360 [Curtobacterium sp. MCBD17_008]|nr:hypothetical protein DEI95_12360 [Curtobacterium sp. MCBD17_008]